MRLAGQLARQLAGSSSARLLLSSPRLAASSPCPACCSPSTARLVESLYVPLATQSWQHQQLRYASKKKHSKGKKSSKASNHEEDEDEIEVEDHPVPVLAKGKKAKAAQITPEDAIEAFNLDKLEKSMDDAVERFQVDSRAVIGRVERLSPGTCIDCSQASSTILELIKISSVTLMHFGNHVSHFYSPPRLCQSLRARPALPSAKLRHCVSIRCRSACRQPF